MMPVIVPDGQLQLSEIQEAKFRVFEQTLHFSFSSALCFLFLYPVLGFFLKSPWKYVYTR